MCPPEAQVKDAAKVFSNMSEIGERKRRNEFAKWHVAWLAA